MVFIPLGKEGVYLIKQPDVAGFGKVNVEMLGKKRRGRPCKSKKAFLGLPEREKNHYEKKLYENRLAYWKRVKKSRNGRPLAPEQQEQYMEALSNWEKYRDGKFKEKDEEQGVEELFEDGKLDGGLWSDEGYKSRESVDIEFEEAELWLREERDLSEYDEDENMSNLEIEVFNELLKSGESRV